MRFTVLDSWRGIAALMVALFHLDVLSAVYGLSLVRNGFLLVDFFFVLSGFVITYAYQDRISSSGELSAFVIRRFGRVWPLHMTVLAAFVALEGFKLVVTAVTGAHVGMPAFDPAGPMSLAALPSHVLLTQGLGVHDQLTWNGPSWSISTEFWMYLLFGLVVWLAGRWRTTVLVAMGMLGAWAVVSWSPTGMDTTFDFGFPRCVLGFVTGHIVYRLHEHVPAPRGIRAVVLEVLAIVAVAAFVMVAGRSLLSFGAPIVFAFAVLVFSWEAGPVSRVLRLRPFQALGDWSYGIYMVHKLIAYGLMLAAGAAQRLMGWSVWAEVSGDQGPVRLISLPGPASELIVLAYVAAVVALAALAHRLVESPGRAYFNRLALALPQSRPAYS